MKVATEKRAASSATQRRRRRRRHRLVRWKSPDTILALLCAGVALALNLFRLGAPSLWMDETFSVALARAPYSVIIGAFQGAEANMFLYYLMLHLWLQLTGWLGLPANELVVRLPSALFATLSALVVYLLGLRLLGRTAGFAAAVVFLLNPLELTYAQQARSYALQVLLICVAWYALLAALTFRTQQRRWWLLFTVVSVLAVYAHIFTLLILLAQVAAFVLLSFLSTPWRERARASAGAMGISLVSILLLTAPLLYVSRSGSKTGWLPSPNVASLVSHYQGVLASRGGHVVLLALVALLALVVLGIASYLLLRRLDRLPKLSAIWHSVEARPQPAVPILIALLAWFLVPVVVSYVISLGPIRIFSTRYLVVVVPAVCLLLGFLVSLIRVRSAQIVAVGILASLAVLFVPSYYAHAQVEDWRSPVHWLEKEYQPGDGLVCYNNVQGCEIAVNYYLVTDHSLATFADAPGAMQLARFGNGDPFANYTAALDPQALSVFGSKHTRIFYIAGRLTGAEDVTRTKAVEAWLNCRYHFVAQTSTAVVTIRLYVTNHEPANSNQAACAVPSAIVAG
ncbi:MAG: glycosyltransferase family 39 protein [Ktedonobacterales bacterium]